MGTQKGRLFELAEMYHSYQKQNRQKRPKKKKKSIEVKGQHFDEGKAISLSYNLQMYPESLSQSHQRQAAAMEVNSWNSHQSEAFYVEPFEVEKTVDTVYKEITEEEDAKLNKIVKKDAGDEMEQDVPENEKQLDKVVAGHDRPAPGEPQESEPKDKKATEKLPAKPGPGPQETPPSADKPPVSPYQASDEEFARDIGAILKGQKLYDADQKKAVSRDETKSAPTVPAKTAPPKDSPAQEDDMLNPIKNKHKIFEQIAKSMQYANSYDLGAIELDQRFDKMEEQIEKEELDKILRNKSLGQEKDSPDKGIFDVEKPERKPGELPGEMFNPKIPLNTTNGGRMIGVDQLQKGDLILATTTADCVSGVYAGNSKMLMRAADDTLAVMPIQDALSRSAVVVALRHMNAESNKVNNVVDRLTPLTPTPPGQPDKWSNVSCPAISTHPEMCNAARSVDKEKCNSYSGKIYLGTSNNNSFMCAASVIDAFEKNQLGFLTATREHNGSLKYFGHLKTNA